MNGSGFTALVLDLQLHIKGIANQDVIFLFEFEGHILDGWKKKSNEITCNFNQNHFCRWMHGQTHGRTNTQ